MLWWRLCILLYPSTSKPPHTKWNSIISIYHSISPFLFHGSFHTFDLAVGILCRSMKSLENALDPSIRAAFLLGEKQGIPATITILHTQSAYLSGNKFLCRRRWEHLVQVLLNWFHFPLQTGLIYHNHGLPDRYSSSLASFPFRHCLRVSIVIVIWQESLPGATKRAVTEEDWVSFQARACSLPPLPINSTRSGSLSSDIGVEKEW